MPADVSVALMLSLCNGSRGNCYCMGNSTKFGHVADLINHVHF